MTVRLPAAPTPLDDIAAADSRLVASPRGTLLGRGAAVALPGARAGLADRATALLTELRGDGAARPVLMGALPFDPQEPACLAAPHDVTWSGPLRPRPVAPPERRTIPRVVPVPSRADYVGGVRAALTELGRGPLRKVVLARALDVHVSVDIPAVVADLARRDPDAYIFTVPLPGSRVLFGASPELLLARAGREVVAHPLAGSAPRSRYAAEDARRATALLGSAKDRGEHRFVVEAVCDALRPLCSELALPREPALVRTGAMWHLGTRIVGTLSDPALTSLAVAERLHPTPAVCGTPVDDARAAIARIEGFERGFYGGMVGWCDADGDGEWILAIRCAEARPGALRVYAGAGIVAGSDPEAELAETGAKSRTLLSAMGMGEIA